MAVGSGVEDAPAKRVEAEEIDLGGAAVIAELDGAVGMHDRGEALAAVAQAAAAVRFEGAIGQLSGRRRRREGGGLGVGRGFAWRERGRQQRDDDARGPAG